jgi:translin
LTQRKDDIRDSLQTITDQAIAELEAVHAAREAGLAASRKLIQISSQSIRAAHRGEFDEARKLSAEAGRVLREALGRLEDQPQVRHSGFMMDGEKEYAESALTVALISGSTLPSFSDLGVSVPAYLNGLAEAASELRRSALDAIRGEQPERADELLGFMDEAMAVLTAIDFPDAVTGGLRRTTDQLRAVTERTRGDVTAALRQSALEKRMSAFERRLDQP